jgi:hypothetical protein
VKVYSDRFTREDMRDAARYAGVGLDTVTPITRPRTRKFGWVVKLTGSSTRHRNSGTHGAATWDSAPATHDEHGRWMAFLFDIDPEAKIADYDGQAQFHFSTNDKYHLTGVAR